MSSTEIEVWKEWRERCAYRLCGDVARESLHRFLGRQLSAKLEELSGPHEFGQHADVLKDLFDSDAETEERKPAVIAWSLLDAYLFLPPREVQADAESPAGSRGANPMRPPEKDALFEGKKNLNHIEATISLKLRDVLRYEIRQRSSRQRSIDVPVTEDANETVKDRIRDDEETAADRASVRDIEELAAVLADNCWEELKPVHRKILGAHGRDLSLSDPLIEEICGLKKSQLYAYQKDLGRAVAAFLETALPREPEQDRLLVAKSLLLIMVKKAADEIFPE